MFIRRTNQWVLFGGDFFFLINLPLIFKVTCTKVSQQGLAVGQDAELLPSLVTQFSIYLLLDIQPELQISKF